MNIHQQERCGGNRNLTFPLLVQFSFPCELYPAKSLRILGFFTTDLINADVSRKTCFGRERYVLLQGIVKIFYIKMMVAERNIGNTCKFLISVFCSSLVH